MRFWPFVWANLNLLACTNPAVLSVFETDICFVSDLFLSISEGWGAHLMPLTQSRNHAIPGKKRRAVREWTLMEEAFCQIGCICEAMRDASTKIKL